MSLIKKIKLVQYAIERQLESISFISSKQTFITPIFILDNNNSESPFNTIAVSSIEEAEKIVSEVCISGKLNKEILDYNEQLYLTVIIELPN